MPGSVLFTSVLTVLILVAGCSGNSPAASIQDPAPTATPSERMIDSFEAGTFSDGRVSDSGDTWSCA